MKEENKNWKKKTREEIWGRKIMTDLGKWKKGNNDKKKQQQRNVMKKKEVNNWSIYSYFLILFLCCVTANDILMFILLQNYTVKICFWVATNMVQCV